MFVFNGEILTEEQIKNIKLQTNEIASFYFYELEEIKNKTVKRFYKRIETAYQNLIRTKIDYNKSKN